MSVIPILLTTGGTLLYKRGSKHRDTITTEVAMVDKCKLVIQGCGDGNLVANTIADIVGFGKFVQRQGHSVPGLRALMDALHTAAYSVPNYTVAYIQAGR